METTTTTKNRAGRLVLGAALLAVGLLVGYLIGNGGGSSSGHDMGDMGGMDGTSDMSSPSSPSSATSGRVSLSTAAAAASATEHNDADVMFAQMMVEHHRQALEMARLADGRAASADVTRLARKIEAAQQPEIDAMNGWLADWKAQPSGPMSGMGQGSGDGMMSQADMASLKGKTGADFDKAFLTMMIQHHRGAITMAQDELKRGRNAQALALAASIAISQQAEVRQMEALLK